MLNRFWVSLIGLMMTACNFAGDKHHAHDTGENPLSWISSASVEDDLAKALEQGDFRLYVVAGRGEVMPGIKDDQKSMLKRQCGTRYIPGLGDVVQDNEHYEQVKQAYQYAEIYNQRISKACLSQ